MPKIRKICANCFYFKRLYVKGPNKFYEQNIAWCNSCKKTVKGNESCEYWVYNSELRKEAKKSTELQSSLRAIDEMQKNLSEIRQILKGD